MNELTQLLNRLHPNYKEIANKWQDRQKLEEELGIPTSDSLTEQFITEEVIDGICKAHLNDIDNMIGELVGR